MKVKKITNVTCGKSFSEAGSLKKHIHTVHEGQKDYKCGFCDESFSQAGHLKRHIHTIHEGQNDLNLVVNNLH